MLLQFKFISIDKLQNVFIECDLNMNFFYLITKFTCLSSDPIDNVNIEPQRDHLCYMIF